MTDGPMNFSSKRNISTAVPADTVRIGLAGCGFYAQNHLHAWSDLRPKGAILSAVCDLDPEKAKAAGEAFGVPWHTDAAQMIQREKIELLDIVTRMDSHLHLARTAAENGIGAIVQKPFAPTIAECRRIAGYADQCGTWLSVHENFRFTDGMRRVKSLLSSGAIGKPNWARISFRTGFDVYRTQPYLASEERFSILDCGTHLLDLARFFLGEVERLSCETQTRNPKVRAEDTATMLLRHRSGAVSVIETTYESRRIPDSFPETLLEIETAEGAIATHPGERMTVTVNGKTVEEDLRSPLRPWTARPWHASQIGAARACEHFLETFKAGCPAETSGADNLKTFALVEAAYLSAAQGRAVRPGEV